MIYNLLINLLCLELIFCVQLPDAVEHASSGNIVSSFAGLGYSQGVAPSSRLATSSLKAASYSPSVLSTTSGINGGNGLSNQLIKGSAVSEGILSLRIVPFFF